jgi:type 1 glutamine amidotransferase
MYVAQNWEACKGYHNDMEANMGANMEAARRAALIVWGGWEGHDPQRVAEMLAPQLEAGGYRVQVEPGVEALAEMDLAAFDVIVPVWSFGIQAPAALHAVLAAVTRGVGLAAFHGGIDWFADREYARMIGGHFVFHPPSNRYTVVVEDRSHAAVQGIDDFVVETEQYYFHLDPGNHVLTSTYFDDLRMPNTWVRTYGQGRVFYCSLAHTLDVLQQEPVLRLLLQGIRWAARA